MKARLGNFFSSAPILSPSAPPPRTILKISLTPSTPAGLASSHVLRYVPYFPVRETSLCLSNNIRWNLGCKIWSEHWSFYFCCVPAGQNMKTNRGDIKRSAAPSQSSIRDSPLIQVILNIPNFILCGFQLLSYCCIHKVKREQKTELVFIWMCLKCSRCLYYFV